MADHAGSDDQVVALGGGHGLACLIRALRGGDVHLTVIASIAAETGDEDDALSRLTGPVGDLRRSLEALTDENAALLHAMQRPLTVQGVGQRHLGDLTLTAVADALGGYGRASMWLGDQLGIDGAVLPATVEPARRHIDDTGSSPSGEPDTRPVRRLRFAEGTDSPEAAVTAIRSARWVLLAPGRLYEHILSTCAVPDLAAALTGTPARVIWIANLNSASGETTEMTGTDCVRALRLHGVRVDAVLRDPAAALAFDASELAAAGVELVASPLRSASDPGTHDPDRLHAALAEMLASHPA